MKTVSKQLITNKLPRLKKEFFLNPTLQVAENLLGKYLVLETKAGIIIGEINEVESYIGKDDPACHAAIGRTKRNEVMFWEGGHAYVYFTYGMYHCLNCVTEAKDFPAAVLIRSIIPVEGENLLLKNRLKSSKAINISIKNLSNGPGKVCQSLNLDRSYNGINLITSNQFYILDSGKTPKFKRTIRIGISKGKNLKWRFYYN